MNREPNFVGQRGANRRLRVAERAVLDSASFDRMFDEPAESEKPPPAPEPEPVPEPEPKQPPLRKADPRDRDTFVPFRGQELQRARQQTAQLTEVEDDTSFGKSRVTHISSDDAWNHRHNPKWNAQLQAGQFHGAQAISSDDLFNKEDRLVDVVAGKLREASKAVKKTFTDFEDGVGGW